MPNAHAAAAELASLLNGSTAGELIPELARNGLQQLNELEASAVTGTQSAARSGSASGTATGPAAWPPR